jgi:transcriptional regulator with XRE-family HTH domain
MSVVELNPQALAGRRKRVDPYRMITGAQIRAARSLLGLSAVALAERAGVSYQTVQRGEAVAGVPPMKSPNLYAIQRALEAAGVVFIDADEQGGPGVRLRR